MKLYFSPGACSLSPHIALAEAGLAVDYVKVNLREKKTEAGDDYLKVNAKGQVPALGLDGGGVLTEGRRSSSTSPTRRRMRSSPRPTARWSATSCRSGLI